MPGLLSIQQHPAADLETGLEPLLRLRGKPTYRLEPLPRSYRITEIFASGEIEVILGTPIFLDSLFDPKNNGEQVKAQADELHAVLVKIGESIRQSEGAYLKKVEAQKEYDKLFTRAARIFEDCCRLIELDDLADRIRPSKKRPGRTEKELPVVVPEIPEETAAETPGGETPKAETPVAEAADREASIEPAAAS